MPGRNIFRMITLVLVSLMSSGAQAVPIDLTNATPSVTGPTSLRIDGVEALGSIYWGEVEWNEDKNRFDVAAYGEDVPTGVENAFSMDFGGTGAQKFVEGPASLSVGSVSTWISPFDTLSNTTAARWLIAWGSNTDAGLMLGAASSKVTDELITIYDGAANWSYAHPTNKIDTGWHHVVFVWNAVDSQTNPGFAGYDIYLDGEFITTEAGASFGTWGGNGSQISVDHIRFGTRAYGIDPGGMPYAGRVDETAIFATSLSAADVRALYNRGVPTDLMLPESYDTPGMEGELTSWWRMGDDDGANAGDPVTRTVDRGLGENTLEQSNSNWQPTYSESVP